MPLRSASDVKDLNRMQAYLPEDRKQILALLLQVVSAVIS
ncbi:hypothetical protein SAMN05660489_06400 [Pseudomonas sp. LAMO17WK12:I10]|nr:hypothetical protein H160_06424 [Pseudomonas sp. LAMO17WK12:I9]SNY54482.1 hypothetical protein SAMN05660489_06400 [Pseudomonas sp. LAMO17WK12:I10]